MPDPPAPVAPRFAAFVSYRHSPLDRAWATRVTDELERFRTPPSLRRLGYRERIGRLFRDDDEAGAGGTLRGQIIEALANSEFLILICSPRTRASEWVRRELELFQSMGKSGKILPLVIEGEPDEVIPEALKSGSDAPLAADVRRIDGEKPSVTLRRAILRLAAPILGCHYHDLAQREQLRLAHMRRRRLVVAAAGLAVAAVAAALWWDAKVRVKSSYFDSYAERWLVPTGLGRLSAEDVSRRYTTFQIKERAGRVIELARVSSRGVLRLDTNIEHFDEPWSRDVARWRYIYLSDGSLSAVEMDDAAGHLVRAASVHLDPPRRVGVAQFGKGLGMVAAGAGNAGALETTTFSADKHRTRIGQHRLTFDQDGRITRRDFEPLGGGDTVGDINGVYGRGYAYDHGGRIARITNLGPTGQPLDLGDRPVVLQAEYDPRGRLSGIAWTNARGHVSPNKSRVARMDRRCPAER